MTRPFSSGSAIPNIIGRLTWQRLLVERMIITVHDVAENLMSYQV